MENSKDNTYYDRTVPPERHRESDESERTMPGKRDRKPDGRFDVGDLIVGRYKVLAELGQGGMGVVYKCFDETAGIEIALKALPPELSHNTLEMEDIKENFQLVSKLVHQNIAISKNLEKDNSNGNYYLIMECVEGEDLRRWIKRKRKVGSLTLDAILPVIRQVAEALDYAHKEKIIHRDIKPGNIMINAAGDVKVLDFGLAAQIHTSMTRISMVYHGTSGTGPYMAPEQWKARAQGAASDQYALAVMTYEMLAGHLPFESQDVAVLREAVLNETAEALPDVPKYVNQVLLRALSKDSKARFSSCRVFAAALSGGTVSEAPVHVNVPVKTPDAIKFSKDSSQEERIQILLKRIRLFLEDNEWQRANEYCEKVLDMDPENAEAYVFLCMIKKKCWSEDGLYQSDTDLNKDIDFRHALRFAGEERKKELQAILQHQQQEKQYQNFCAGLKEAMDSHNYAVLLQKEKDGLAIADYQAVQNLLDSIQSLIRSDISQAKDSCDFSSQVETFKKFKPFYSDSFGYKAECDVLLDSLIANIEKFLSGQTPDIQQLSELRNNVIPVFSQLRPEAAESLLLRIKLSFIQAYTVLAESAFEKENYENAVKYAEKADSNDLRIQKILAYCYSNEKGITQNNIEAIKWYRKAAEQGDPNAQFKLGMKYAKGQGIEKNEIEAVKWYRKAAESGHAEAQFNLATMYNNGQGIEQDYTEAIKWYRKAAEQGFIDAQSRLGIMYYNGEGTTSDYVEAVKWYRKAAALGNAKAQFNLAEMYGNGLGTEQDYAEAVKWYDRAAEQGHAVAQYRLGYAYERGQGVKENEAEAISWYRKAAEQGNAEAQFNLGRIYSKGQSEQDYAEAVKYYKKAAEQGHIEAQNSLGKKYYYGQGVGGRNYIEAEKWFRKAAEQGLAAAQFNLAEMYKDGQGDEQNYTESIKWYRKAAEQGDADAQFNLGKMYSNGEGVKQNYEEARMWYHKAAKQGHKEAHNRLGEMYCCGIGVRRDKAEAIKWYQKNGGDANFKEMLHHDNLYTALLTVFPILAVGILFLVCQKKETILLCLVGFTCLFLFLFYKSVSFVDYLQKIGEKRLFIFLTFTFLVIFNAFLGGAAMGDVGIFAGLGSALCLAFVWFYFQYLFNPSMGLLYGIIFGGMIGGFACLGDNPPKPIFYLVVDILFGVVGGGWGAMVNNWFPLNLPQETPHERKSSRWMILWFLVFNGILVGCVYLAIFKDEERQKQEEKYKNEANAIAEKKAKSEDKKKRLAEANTVAEKARKDAEEKQLIPTFDFHAKVGDHKVPVIVHTLKTAIPDGEWPKKLEEGKEYAFRITHKAADGSKYEGVLAFICDWKGPKIFHVKLQKDVFIRTVMLPGSIKLDMVKIGAGTFPMGSPDWERERSNDEELHCVTLTKDFYIGKYEVTQSQWHAVMESNPSYFKGNSLPVESVSWDDAMEFCRKLNGLTAGERPDGYKFSLPTEAQWEYACRAGTTSAFYYGYSSNTKMANFDGNYPCGYGVKGLYRKKTIEVGSLAPNPWGLYGMHGNVWEWCLDRYEKYRGDAIDPASTRGSYRVRRGGSWNSSAACCRSGFRGFISQDLRDSTNGFRVALVQEQ